MGVICEICKKSFTKQINLNRHCREVHSSHEQVNSFNRNIYNFKCLDCDYSFSKNSDLIEHLQYKHSYTISEENILFQSLEEFKSWKFDTEAKENCSYISTTGKKTRSSGDEVQYFNCNRSVNTKSRKLAAKDIVSRRRNIKSQGYSKLTFSCISRITLRKQGNTFQMNRVSSHYGHSNEIKHIRIGYRDRQNLASKLVDGVSVEKLLDDTRTKIRTDYKRMDILTRQDLVNIKRSYNIHLQEGVKHKDDAISVDVWVKECQAMDTNPVLLYKPQGHLCESFNVTDFCLIVMNEVQAQLLCQFGKNVIAIDSTHGLNNYDFEMTTLMVIDDFNEGFPVAFMFTNRKDTQINATFFYAIKQKVGNIKCKTFMSDITGTFYNAWVQVMDLPQYQLFCSWHIDRAWRCNLNKINNREKKELVYKTLKYLQKNTDIAAFKEQLKEAVDNMLNDSDTKSFGQYFATNYSQNYLTWAYCFRKNCGINTNMRLESMHKVIKYFYLNGKCVKRLDKGLHATLKYVRDKIVDRVIKHTKGKRSITNELNFKRHRLAVSSSFSINEINTESWHIVHEDTQYLVEKTSTLQKCCNLSCQFCDICVHQYSCSCPDSFINNIICKHIHFLALNNTKKNYCQNEPLKIANAEETAVDQCMSFFNKSNLKVDCDKKGKLLNEISDLQMVIRNQDTNISDSVFQQTISNIHTVKTLLQLPSSSKENVDTSFKNVTKTSASKNIVAQHRFFSTRKKKQTSATRLRNPNKDELTEIANNLSINNKALFVSRDSTMDHNYC